MNIYLISGLGADKRVFSKLVFSTNHVIKHIEWIKPNFNEDLSSYARRLARQIDESKPFFLVGVSFGGMIAVELNKFISPLQTIIISSASTDAQIPWYYKIVGRLKIYKLIPVKVLKAPTPLTFWFFGTKTKEEKSLLTQILKDTDGSFLKWAISKITNWDQKITLKGIYHVHGTADRILPVAFIQPDFNVINGGHLMVYSQNEIITKILADWLG
jgi:hypothetical protein